MAVLTVLSSQPFFHMRNNEIPIIIKSAVHTGKNTQLGGAKDGFRSVAYQVGIAGVVKYEPIKPANRQMNMLNINFFMSEKVMIVIIVSQVNNISWIYLYGVNKQ
jgi:hypothetical protein